MSHVETSCICGQTHGRTLVVKERQLGLGDEFLYVKCDFCDSLRIAAIPKNLDRFYPKTYYSFTRPPNDWRHRLQTHAVRFAMYITQPRFPQLHFPWAFVTQATRIRRTEKVLDVGSGVQGMAGALWQAGHRNVIGIDPFIEKDIREPNFGVILKKFLHEVSEPQDVIAFNHSLEHIEDPLTELQNARKLLRPAPSSRIVVRIPVAAWAYQEYQSAWFQLDAPRHLFIPTQKGFESIAARAGLRIAQVIYDSDYTQIWISELYARDMPFIRPGTEEYWQRITRDERRKLNRRAEHLNRTQAGDQAIFILKPESAY